MHWVKRGPEPVGLAAIRIRFTSRWVQHYRNGVGRKPTDCHWRDFHEDLRDVFYGLCAYCERNVKGEVDHFHPKSRYPDLVYSWSNWLFTCHDCNHAKADKWPKKGYVNPCATSKCARPESLFRFDTQTGEILTQKNLTTIRRHRAQQTIDDLQLNEFHHLRERSVRLKLLAAILQNDLSRPTQGTRQMPSAIAWSTSRTETLSSITRTWLSEQGYQI